MSDSQHPPIDVESVAWDAPGGASYSLKRAERSESTLQVLIRGDFVEIRARDCDELHTQRLTGEPDSIQESLVDDLHAAVPLARCFIVARRLVRK